jgi:peptide/nickel transport system substrate-binding protein
VRSTWRTRAVLAPLAVLALVAPAACGGGTSGGGGTAPPPKATENQINPLADDKVQDGGKLTWALSGIPANFNASQLDGTDADNAAVVSALLPTTYQIDAAGNPAWDRNYLASAPKLETEPKQKVTYNINPKAVWYDGTPVTWEDFLWQWKATNGTDKAYQVASTTGYDQVESVEKGKDEREVVVTYKEKFADWTSVFTGIYPKSTNMDPKVFNEGWKDQPLTTAGPFKLDKVDKTGKTITLVRNEKWWGTKAKLDTIVYRAIEPNAQIDALNNGEIDFADLGPDVNKTNRAKGMQGIEIRRAAGPNFRHLTINGTSPNLQDVKVRQALAMGIDRNAIGKALLGPLGYDPKPLNNHIFMTNQDGYTDNSGDVGKFNQDKAKTMLDDAGWKLDGSVRKKDGKPLEINFVIPTGVATSKQESELIQNMLAQIGVTVKINAVPVDDFFDKYITPGQFDFTVFSWLGTAYPISSSSSIYKNPTKNDKGELDIQQNYARVGSKEIDDLFAQAVKELDRKKATEIANKIDGLIWQEVHSLTTYQRPEQVACKKGLANYGAFGFATVDYTKIGWAKA